MPDTMLDFSNMGNIFSGGMGGFGDSANGIMNYIMGIPQMDQLEFIKLVVILFGFVNIGIAVAAIIAERKNGR